MHVGDGELGSRSTLDDDRHSLARQLGGREDILDIVKDAVSSKPVPVETAHLGWGHRDDLVETDACL